MKPWLRSSVRRLATQANEAAKPTNVSIKAYEDLPSLPRGLPIVGNRHMLMSGPQGPHRLADNFIKVGKEYDKDGVGMVRINSQVMNPGKGEGKGVLVFDADIVEQVFRYYFKRVSP